MKGMKITINEDGTVEVEAQGYSGPACEKDLKKIKDAIRAMGLSTNILSERKKQEFFSKKETNKLKR